MSWKLILKALRNRDMVRRLLVVAGLIMVYRFLAFVPIPLAEPAQLKTLLESLFNSQQLLGFLDLLSGGALSNFSIVLLGLGPYINASIIMQLLTKAIPKLEEINEDGESGRKRINQYTRILTLPLAVIQSIGILLIVRQQVISTSGIDITADASIMRWVLMVATLSAASILIMWIGELITEQGVGNGISLLIFAGIIASLPQTITVIVSSLINSVGGENVSQILGFTLPVNLPVILYVGGFVIATILVTYFVVKLNEAQRVLTVSYAKRVRGNRTYGGVNTVLPIKLIIAGVIPIIFAVSFLSVPPFLGQLMQTADSELLQHWGQNLVNWFQTPGLSTNLSANTSGSNVLIYSVVYFLLVVLFTYFYTGVQFNAKQIAENLQRQGGFIPGIRPGKQTEEYLKKIVNRLNLFGSTSLGLLAVLPFIAQSVFGTAQLTIGGTGILIVVAVAIESLRQIESRALMVTYDKY